MITGANTNIRYRGIVYHVQTEDSGRAYPHIISHLYHGGTILASEKTDYSGQVESADLERIVRGYIEQQHREMVRRLQAGGFDAVIEERLGDSALRATDPVETPTPIPEVAPVEIAAAPPEPASSGPRGFGDGVSQKPLDEMILDYLAEKARGRASARAPARKSSSNG